MLKYEDRADHLKIGRTRDLQQRLASYSTGSHVKPEFVYTQRCLDAPGAERAVHTALHAHRCSRTEWFEVPQDVAERTIKQVIHDQHLLATQDLAKKLSELSNKLETVTYLPPAHGDVNSSDSVTVTTLADRCTDVVSKLANVQYQLDTYKKAYEDVTRANEQMRAELERQRNAFTPFVTSKNNQ